MKPEQDPRIAKAYNAMRNLGIDQQTVKPVLSRLLVLYNRNWELIEEDNFRTLADAIFEHADDKLMVEKNGDVVIEGVEPPLKKQHRGPTKDEVLSPRDKERNVENSKDIIVPKTSRRTRMVESSSVSREPTGEPHRRVSHAPSRSKHKDVIKTGSAPNGEISFSQSSSSAVNANCESTDPGLGSKMRRKAVDHEDRNAIVPRKRQASDHPPLVAIPISGYPGSISTSQQFARNNKIESSSSMKRLPRDDSRSFGSGDAGKDHPDGSNMRKVLSSSESLDLHTVTNVQEPHVAQSNKKRVFRELSDITKGTENVKISLLDEKGTEALSPFIYCPENITYESAYVNISLARISDEDCCRCKGDCLSSSISCACARDTGGEYAYTPEGLLTEKFLKSCITMKMETRDQDLFYCQDCPLERAKNGSTPEKCKGHLLRKFIKECWRKCRCDMKCGNRVVQRGITRRLQVFLTSKGKGWGLRTLEDLPKGAFVCEYVGEILTNIELYERNKRYSGNEKHVYPVLLDADWATEGVLKDEEALCLDATHYGNVARFINHRCFDGNIIEVPVQVETPDRHYYHLAFFTKRKVDAQEELTWDYGIDFDDDSHPIKAFRCRCGSQLCRDRKRKAK